MPDYLDLRRAPTERDVARLAGVSQSAMSRAFTRGASVAEDTENKVVIAAQSLGYMPNLVARSLATSRTNIVALAISNLENPFYVQVVKELSDRYPVRFLKSSFGEIAASIVKRGSLEDLAVKPLRDWILKVAGGEVELQ